MDSDFYMVKRLPQYVFAEINRLKSEARSQGRDIIDFGMGTPDLPSPQHVVDKVKEVIQDPSTHKYSESRGIKALRKAVAGYYDRRFGVPLDFESEIIATLGSKEGLVNLAQAIAAPGDVILTPNPGYPIHQFGFIIAGASVRNIPVDPNENFMEALDRAVRYSVPKPIMLLLNYPSNPTTHTVDLEFYEKVVQYCLKEKIWVVSDLAYAEIYFDIPPPPSILQVPNGKKVAIEFTSMSKTYSMSGWRVGFACGNSELVGALRRVKSYTDYGIFAPLQVAALTALNGPQDYLVTMRETYKRRRDVMVEGLNKLGFNVDLPDATMFVWAPIPEKFRHMGSAEFSKLLLAEADIAVSAGLGFGEFGDGHIRFALVENEHRIRQALRNLRRLFEKKKSDEESHLDVCAV